MTADEEGSGRPFGDVIRTILWITFTLIAVAGIIYMLTKFGLI